MDLTFLTPWLLAGLLATFIPLLLHLLARARAQEVLFPSLRFLQVSMEKTARRRRVQHWLLLVLRMLLLALLALAVAQPVVGGWDLAGDGAAVVILDDSLSMAARSGGRSRFSRARNEAETLLSGEHRPAVAALLTATGAVEDDALTARLDALRQRLAETDVSCKPAALAQRVRLAIDLLADSTLPKKFIYVFSDLQRHSFAELTRMRELAAAEGVHLLVVDASGGAADNVAVSEIRVTGQRIVDQVAEVAATLTNSSPRAREVEVTLRVEGEPVGPPQRRSLAPAGQEGGRTILRFYLPLQRPGPLNGSVSIDAIGAERIDDLPEDNVRYFSFHVGGRVRATVFRGAVESGDNPLMAPHALLEIALDPFSDPARPWSIRPTVLPAAQLTPETLAGADAAFCCGVASFSAEQARALRDFVSAGRTAVIFPGPGTDPANYNQALGPAFLPARLGAAVGEVGPAAGGVPLSEVDREHVFLRGLYEDLADYLAPIVQRYFPLEAAADAEVLMRLDNGAPLMVLRRYGGGLVGLCATSASPRWSNFPTTGLFLPMVTRMSLLSRPAARTDQNYVAGARVVLRPETGGAETPAGRLAIVPPGADPNDPLTTPLRETDRGAVAEFAETAHPGVYTWSVTGEGERAAGGRGGAFAVNPAADETDLRAYSGEAFARAMHSAGVERVYVGDSAGAVAAAAAEDAKGENWWKYLIVAAVFVLVIESVVANRIRGAAQAVPAHLNPTIA